MKILVAVVVVSALVSACSGGRSKPQPTETATQGTTQATVGATAVATTTPDIDAVFGVVVTQLKRGDPVPLPKGIVLYARDGVWEGASGNLTRYYVDAAGHFRSDDLIVSKFGEDPRALRRAFGTGVDDLWAEICHGSCYGGPDPVTTIRSEDGGITWQTVFEANNLGRYVLGSYGVEVVVREWAAPGPLKLSRGMIGGALTSVAVATNIPADADAIAASGVPGVPILVYSADKLTVWNVETGAVVAKVPLPNPFQHLSIQGFSPGSDGNRLMMTWYGPGSSPNWDWYFGEFDLRTGEFSHLAKARIADGMSPLYGLQWLSPTRAIARVGFNIKDYVPGGADYLGPGIPAIIDFGTGVVTPIAEFVDQIGAKAGGPIPLFVQLGGFAIVKTGGDCLNIRETPALSGTILGCYADRVILAMGGAEPSGTWLPVLTPDGQQGWASAEFLEQFP
ncbi:MAG: SH3 domain-containing protein [Dehalococcoidia bacterium]